jgi:hypothetical protein
VEDTAKAMGSEHSAELIEADIRALDLGRRFDRVFIPFNGIYLMGPSTDFVVSLSRARAHLAAGGRLVFDAYCADDFHDVARGSDEEPEELVLSVEWDGRTWDVYESSRWFPKEQRADVRYRFVSDDSETRHLEIRHWYFLSRQLGPLLSRAGLVATALYGDFDGGPFDDRSDIQVVVAQAAG